MNRLIILLLILIIGLSLLGVVLSNKSVEHFSIVENDVQVFIPVENDEFNWKVGDNIYLVRIENDPSNLTTKLLIERNGKQLLGSGQSFTDSAIILDNNKLLIMNDNELSEILIDNDIVSTNKISDDVLFKKYKDSVMSIIEKNKDEIKKRFEMGSNQGFEQPIQEIPLEQQQPLQPLDQQQPLQPLVEEPIQPLGVEPQPFSSCDDKLFRIEQILNE